MHCCPAIRRAQLPSSFIGHTGAYAVTKETERHRHQRLQRIIQWLQKRAHTGEWWLVKARGPAWQLPGQKVDLTDFDEANLMDGDVTVRVEWSTVNYKDGLALTGRAPVVRRFPMIAGIDFAGTVESSSHPQWKPGDRVILNGWGLGETHLGGYAEKARVKGDWLVRLPARNSARGAMAIGTAGFTAMLAVMALERHGGKPRH